MSRIAKMPVPEEVATKLGRPEVSRGATTNVLDVGSGTRREACDEMNTGGAFLETVKQILIA